MVRHFENGSVFHGDCLEVMQTFPAHCVDMVFADLPYGTSYAEWDNIIPMDKLWKAYERVCTPNAALVFTAVQPFTSLLIASNPKMFRCEWIWDKVNASNFSNAKIQPLKQHESVLVFSKERTVYNPQMTPGKPNHKQGSSKTNISETRKISGRSADDLSGMKYPKTILTIPKHSSQCGLHPTQKPIDLMKYFINTYSNPGQLILDNVCGSGGTLVAADELGRSFLGIEAEEKYFNTACSRLK